MNIIGLDISPTSSGLVKFILDEEMNILEIKKLGFYAYEIPKKKKFEIPNFKDIISYNKNDYDFFNRTIMMTEHIFEFIKDVDYACMESYAYGAKGNITEIAEFTSQIKFQLLRQGTKLRLIEPLTLKMYATDNGKSQKPEMYDAFIELNEPKCYIDDLPKIKVHTKGKNKGKREKSGQSPLSDTVDAFWLVHVLYNELRIKKGIKSLSDLTPNQCHILSRKTKLNQIPIYEKEFIEKKI